MNFFPPEYPPEESWTDSYDMSPLYGNNLQRRIDGWTTAKPKLLDTDYTYCEYGPYKPMQRLILSRILNRVPIIQRVLEGYTLECFDKLLIHCRVPPQRAWWHSFVFYLVGPRGYVEHMRKEAWEELLLPKFQHWGEKLENFIYRRIHAFRGCD
jgi:hypothetical protein